MNPIEALKAYLERIGFPESVTAELTPALDGLSDRSRKLLGSYMARRARYNLLNHGVTESALKAFKDDRPRTAADRKAGVEAGIEAAAKKKDDGPRANADGQYELRISGAIVSDKEVEEQSAGASLVAPKTVQGFLDTLPQGAPVLLLVNSPGGDFHAATEMADALNRWGGEVSVRITGLAASAGGYLALKVSLKNGTSIECVSGGKWMFHEASLGGISAAKLRTLSKTVESTTQQLADVLAKGSQLSDEEALAAVKDPGETWYDSAEAEDIGLSIAEDLEPDPKTDLSPRAERESRLSRELLFAFAS